MGHGCSRALDVVSDTTTSSHPSDRSPTSSRLGLLVTGEGMTQMAHVDDSAGVVIPSPAHSSQFREGRGSSTHEGFIIPVRIRQPAAAFDSPCVSPCSRQQHVTLLPFTDGLLLEESSPTSHISSRCPSNFMEHRQVPSAYPQDIPSPSLIPHHEQQLTTPYLPPTASSTGRIGNATRVPRFAHSYHNSNTNNNGESRQSSSSPQSYSRSDQADSLRHTHSGSDPLSNHFDSFLGSPGLGASAPNPLAAVAQFRTSRSSAHSLTSGGVLSIGGARAMDAFCPEESTSGSLPSGANHKERAAGLPHVLPIGSISSKDLRTFPAHGLVGASKGALSGTGEDGALGSPWVGHNGLYRGIGQDGLFAHEGFYMGGGHRNIAGQRGTATQPPLDNTGLKRVTSMLDEATTTSRGGGHLAGIDDADIPHVAHDDPAYPTTFFLE